LSSLFSACYVVHGSKKEVWVVSCVTFVLGSNAELLI